MTTYAQTAENLKEVIKRHSSVPMTHEEATEGTRNLAGFFNLLIQIEIENQKKK